MTAEQRQDRLRKYERILRHALMLVEAHVVTLQYRYRTEWLAPGTREGRATLDGSTVIIRTPEPLDPVSLAIGLHECGHVLHGHLWRQEKYLYRPDTEQLRAQMRHEDDQHLIPNEMEASRFALTMLRLHGLHPMDIDAAERFLIEALEQYGVDHYTAQVQLVDMTSRILVTTNPCADVFLPEPSGITKGSGFDSQELALEAGQAAHPDGSIRTFKSPSDGWTWLLLRDPT